MNPGLPPIVGDSPRVLLLGSFPSEKALRTGEYYANKRNQFWDLCNAVFGVPADLPYGERLDGLKRRGVALWDVLQSGERNETTFAIDLASAAPNELRSFLDYHPSIRVIALNGRTATDVFERQFAHLRSRGVEIVSLPSSRGAYEPMTLAQKIEAWSVLRQYADVNER